MNTKNILLISIMISMIMTCCDKAEYQSLSFYNDYREVPVNGTIFISPKTGSGNYTLEVENPLILSAEMQTDWSNSTGMIAIQGRLKGNTRLTVTDNLTKESLKLKLKVTDNYEVLQISKYYDHEKKEEFPLPPSLQNMEWISLVNNRERDLYLVSRENISLTDYALKVCGKGSYEIDREGDNYCLTLSYWVDEKEQPTLNENIAKKITYRFNMSNNELALHKLNQSLNLGLNTSMPDDWKEFINHAWETNIDMEGVGVEYKFIGTLLPDYEMPINVLN